MSAFRPRQGESKPARTWTAIVVALGTALALVAAFGGPKDLRRTDGGNVAFAIGACGASDRTGETAQNATDKAGSIDEGDPTRTIVSNDPGTPTDHAV